MRNKWIIILILLAIIFINPSKKVDVLNFIGKNNVQLENINKVDIGSDYESVIYNETIVCYDGKTLKNLNLNGDCLFEININSKDNSISSNKYIDILDKENSIVYSINKNGKIIFKKSVPKGGILYKSLRDDVYVYGYKKDNKNVINIYDNDQVLLSSVELGGSITDIEIFNNHIYVVELNTDKYLGSNIYKYDYNGNLKNSKSIENSIVVGVDINKDSIILITNNSIENMDSNLETKDSKEIKEIKYYSNIYNDEIYVIEGDNNISLISDKIKNINLNDIDAKGVINNGENSIVYSENKIITTKNKEVKKYEDTIKSIEYIKEDICIVNLEGYIEIIKIK